MKVIKATENHINKIFHIFKDAAEYHDNIHPNVFAGTDSEKQTKWFKGFINKENSLFLVSLDNNDNVTGFVLGEILERKENYKIRKHFYVHKLAVDEECRRQGIATALYSEFKKQVKESFDVTEIELRVYGRNEIAHKFYQSLGMNLFFSNFIEDVK